jgi:hypothetical protein
MTKIAFRRSLLGGIALALACGTLACGDSASAPREAAAPTSDARAAADEPEGRLAAVCMDRGGPRDVCVCLDEAFARRATDEEYEHTLAFEDFQARYPLRDLHTDPQLQSRFAEELGRPPGEAFRMSVHTDQLMKQAIAECDEALAAADPPARPLPVAEYPTAIVGEWQHEKTASRRGDQPGSAWSMTYRSDGTYAECRRPDARLPLACKKGSYFVRGSSLQKEGLAPARVVSLTGDHLVLSLGSTDRFLFRRIR